MTLQEEVFLKGDTKIKYSSLDREAEELLAWIKKQKGSENFEIEALSPDYEGCLLLVDIRRVGKKFTRRLVGEESDLKKALSLMFRPYA